jgi:hypothetical protein
VKAPPPASARDAKLTVRHASAACRAVRIRWTTLRDSLINVLDLANGSQKQLIGELTAELWIAERVLAEAAAGWRKVLAERETLPIADRWNLVDMERWASAQAPV